MSRSVRKPYSSCVNYRSLVLDRRKANKGVRQAFRQALRRGAAEGYENFLPPHRFECSHNEVYSWDCDGLPWYQFDHIDRQWSTHCLYHLAGNRYLKVFAEWPPKWMAKLTRK